MAYETIIVTVEDHVALIKLNRPDALNALNDQLMQELAEALGEVGNHSLGSQSPGEYPQPRRWRQRMGGSRGHWRSRS